ncbi:hypothetical protein DL764_005179 [Monosporascus ibericus]|uniref:GED domain-containing protein n=1 Tax=Monosporascus ibericus TaxID=155417 RepID=A0A4Q4TCP0_9PEZI|nr:hypothetical protein DL764_005179 [Monosporascus ibericus]
MRRSLSPHAGFQPSPVTGPYGTNRPSHGAGADRLPDPVVVKKRKRSDSVQGTTTAPSASQDSKTFVHSSFSEIGLKLKAYNDTLADLQQLDVSNVVELPELVLVGDQSAGKSSLMSGIAEISLPASGGVCTRCPIHIRLSRSSEPRWSCTVWLQQDYEYRPPRNDQSITKQDVTTQNPFPPWARQPRVVTPFKTIYEKSEIEDVLRWAQIATLNPGCRSDHFVPKGGIYTEEKTLAEAAEETEAQFSPNIVSLEIKGPNMPFFHQLVNYFPPWNTQVSNGSFYDLPGVFNTPGQEKDEYLVEVVRNLSRQYISHSRAIILWAVPMNADPELSLSYGIIRESKARDRTVGVITKADLLPAEPGNVSQWLLMLQGQKHPVGHGYFITSRKQNNHLEVATSVEKQFFSDETGRWPVEFREYSNRAGIEILKAFVSEKLGDAFSESLPNIKHQVELRRKSLEGRLLELPELPLNIEFEVRRSLSNLWLQVKEAMESSALNSEWKKLSRQFYQCILDMKPSCIVKDRSDIRLPDVTEDSDVEVISSVRKHSLLTESPIRANKRMKKDQESPLRAQDGNPFSNPIHGSSAGYAPSSEKGASPFRKFLENPVRIRLPEIRRKIEDETRPGVRSIVPIEVYERLALDAIRRWEEPMLFYMEKTMTLLGKAIESALWESLGNLQRRLIFKETLAHMEEFLVVEGTSQAGLLRGLYNLETYSLFTLNEAYSNRHEQEELEHLTRMRALYRLDAAQRLSIPIRIDVRDLSDEEAKEERRIMTNILPQLSEDQFRNEVQVAAFVRGYYITAAHRFAESVTLSINGSLFRGIKERQINLFLEQKLGIEGSAADRNAFARLMEEDENTAKERKQLKAEIKKLTKALTSISELEESLGSSPRVGDLPQNAIPIWDGVVAEEHEDGMA